MLAEQNLQDGKLDEALVELQQEVREHPTDSRLRMFLFQLLAVMGDWERSLRQLNVAAELDAEHLLLAQMCGPALRCEPLRVEVFAGRRTPLIFGEPTEWMAWLVQALQLDARGERAEAASMRAKAFEVAQAVPGVVDGTRFEWLADADSRLGPVLEAVIGGRYFWVPMDAVRRLTIDAPTRLLDLVWVPASFVWTNGGESAAFIPLRYVGTPDAGDPALALSRKTTWEQLDGETYAGLGQRMFSSDVEEYPLAQIRTIEFDVADTTAAERESG